MPRAGSGRKRAEAIGRKRDHFALGHSQEPQKRPLRSMPEPPNSDDSAGHCIEKGSGLCCRWTGRSKWESQIHLSDAQAARKRKTANSSRYLGNGNDSTKTGLRPTELCGWNSIPDRTVVAARTKEDFFAARCLAERSRAAASTSQVVRP